MMEDATDPNPVSVSSSLLWQGILNHVVVDFGSGQVHHCQGISSILTRMKSTHMWATSSLLLP